MCQLRSTYGGGIFYKNTNLFKPPNHKTNMEFNIIVEKGEDGYLISEVVELPGCHTQGKTMEELLENTREAISLYLKVVGADSIKEKFIGLKKLEV